MYLEKLGHRAKKCHQITFVFKRRARGTLISTHRLIHQLGGFQLPVSLSFSASISASELRNAPTAGPSHHPSFNDLVCYFICWVPPDVLGRHLVVVPASGWLAACQGIALKRTSKAILPGKSPSTELTCTVLPSHLGVQPRCVLLAGNGDVFLCFCSSRTLCTQMCGRSG